MNVVHGVGKFPDVEEPFSAKPRRIGPAETLAKGVVGCNDIPVTSRIGDVYSAFRPIV
jgi:hypothetical protein